MSLYAVEDIFSFVMKASYLQHSEVKERTGPNIII